MKAWIHPALSQRFRLVCVWWCGGYFLAHFGSLSTNWASFKRHSLPELLLTMSIPLWLQCTHLLMYFQQDSTMSQSSIISDWFLEHDNEFTLLKWPPQSPDLNPIEQLWDGGTRFTSWMCSRQICSNCVILSCQYGPKSLRNVSNTLLNLLRKFWRQKGVHSGTSKVYLIKWSVSVYVNIIDI